MDEVGKLMSELSCLKRLATALVRDESDANDLVQDTWLIAAEHAPTDGRPLKPWLSRVALNLLLADQQRIEIHEQPPSSGPDGRFQILGPSGARMLVILGRVPTTKRGLAVTAGATIDVGDVIVGEEPK